MNSDWRSPGNRHSICQRNGILPEQSRQTQLFDERTSNSKLMAAVDKINARFGQGSVFLASNGTGQQWHMLSTMPSRRYTTKQTLHNQMEGIASEKGVKVY
jgi:hypothetical protein